MKKSYIDILTERYKSELDLREKRTIISDPSDSQQPQVVSGKDTSVAPGPSGKEIIHGDLSKIRQDDNPEKSSPLEEQPEDDEDYIDVKDTDQQEEPDTSEVYNHSEEEIESSFDDLRKTIFNTGEEQNEPVDIEDDEVQEAKDPAEDEEGVEPAPDEEDPNAQQDPNAQDVDPATGMSMDPNEIPPDDPNMPQDPGAEPNAQDPNAQQAQPMMDPNVAPPQDPNAGMDPNAQQDPNAIPPQDPNAMGGGMPGSQPGMPGQDPNAMGGMGMGMGEPNKPQTSTDVGRIYELKKIHARINAVDSYLSTMMDPNLEKLKAYITKTTDMFNTVISNYDLFKQKIDDIIVQFYTFLREVYTFLRDYFEVKQNKEDNSEDENDVDVESKTKDEQYKNMSPSFGR